MSNAGELTGESIERLRYLLSRANASGEFVAVWDGGWAKGEEIQDEIVRRVPASLDLTHYVPLGSIDGAVCGFDSEGEPFGSAHRVAGVDCPACLAWIGERQS